MSLHKYLFVLCLGILFGCKKEIKNPPEPPRPDPTEDERIKASIYDYYNKYSLWTDHIPDLDENGRLDFVKKYGDNQRLLLALKNMTPFYAGYSGSIDRFSFIDESDADGTKSYANGFRMDSDEGYGLHYGWGVLSKDEKKAYPVIYFVEGGSPAQKKGITRGSIVYEVNGDRNISVGYDGTSLNQTDVRNVGRKLQTALEASSLNLKVVAAIDEENQEQEYSLGYQRSYEIDPVILDTIYHYPSKKIGYLAYSSFEEVWPVTHRNYIKLQNIFNSFQAANIKDLILDLRYNTGGYVSTAEYLANKMVKATDHGKLMFKYDVNDYLATSLRYKSDFEDVYFENRDNKLTLENVYVLVTEQTASASELLINVLKPYLNVTIIAEENRTYGKPVGFFPEDITDDVTLWVTSFKTTNAAGYSDYWKGLTPDVSNIQDYIFRDFGDVEENMIAKALESAGVKSISSSLRASSRGNNSVNRSKKLGIINKTRERNMLKMKE